MPPRKKTAAKAEPQIEWRSAPQGTAFIGTVGDITYRVVADTAEDGNATWVTEVRLSDNKPRSLEDAKELAEKDLS